MNLTLAEEDVYALDGACHIHPVNCPKTYPVGRRCAHEGCTTILSRYNPGKYCGAHEQISHPGPRPCGTKYVPVAIVAEHIDALLARGMTWAQIARIYDISPTTPTRISRQSYPRVERSVAAKIMAIPMEEPWS